MQSKDPQKVEAFDHLFKCLMALFDQMPGVPDHPHRMFYAKAIPIKIVRQVATVCHMQNPIPFPFHPESTVTDPISIEVVIRSVLESYLIWEQIFVVAQTEEEKEFWYFAWALKSLKLRISLDPPLPEEQVVVSTHPLTGKKGTMKAKDVHANMTERVAELKDALVKNTFFISVTKGADKKRSDRFVSYVNNGWTMSPSALFENSMGNLHSKKVYDFLAASAHLDHVEVKQIIKMRTHEELSSCAEVALSVLLHVLAKLCDQIPTVFPKTKRTFDDQSVKTLAWIKAYLLVS